METPTFKYNHGGLLRCCLLSLHDEMARRAKSGKPLTVEDDIINCEYCKKPTLICKDSTWQWNRAAEV